jgi:transcriptional regulator with XRE-family HTH domain
MQQFSAIVKMVRSETGLSQDTFAKKLGVSTIYISKIETGQKEASKQFLSRLADFVEVHPATLAPFLYTNQDVKKENLGAVEKLLIQLGDELQKKLIQKKLNT